MLIPKFVIGTLTSSARSISWARVFLQGLDRLKNAFENSFKQGGSMSTAEASFQPDRNCDSVWRADRFSLLIDDTLALVGRPVFSKSASNIPMPSVAQSAASASIWIICISRRV
ncbi:MAG: hypothetical protein CBCREVIR_1480 [Candidatus Burkholderia crenata]|nr:MAG: hypothetical protein CBCREVIR_1480 [Candidatus Burkholderia crenata]